jgi:hypothetical protein
MVHCNIKAYPLLYSLIGGYMFQNLYDVESYEQWWLMPARMEELPAGLIVDEI